MKGYLPRTFFSATLNIQDDITPLLSLSLHSYILIALDSETEVDNKCFHYRKEALWQLQKLKNNHVKATYTYIVLAFVGSCLLIHHRPKSHYQAPNQGAQKYLLCNRRPGKVTQPRE